jgi:hypothetical protein
LSSISRHPSVSLFGCNYVVSSGGSSSTKQVVVSLLCVAQGPEVFFERSSASKSIIHVRGFQLSGTINILLSEKSGGRSMSGSSSTKVLGGELATVITRRRLRLAIVTTRSNFLCLFLLESAAYQSAPLRGFPLTLGMARARINAKTLRTLLLPYCSGGFRHTLKLPIRWAEA